MGIVFTMIDKRLMINRDVMNMIKIASYANAVVDYNPKTKDMKLNKESAEAWIKKGAQPTDTVRNILSQNGTMKKFHEQKNGNK